MTGKDFGLQYMECIPDESEWAEPFQETDWIFAALDYGVSLEFRQFLLDALGEIQRIEAERERMYQQNKLMSEAK